MITKQLLDKKIADAKKKISKIAETIEKRQTKSKLKYPTQNILEVETVLDGVEMARIEGNIEALTNLKRYVK